MANYARFCYVLFWESFENNLIDLLSANVSFIHDQYSHSI